MPQTPQTFETRCLSSLVKVFADEPLGESETPAGTALLGEVYSFQVAYRSSRLVNGMAVRAEGDLSDIATVRSVGLAPCELPWRDSHDDNVLRTTPGLYPDPLYPIDETGITAFPEQWRSVWITVPVPESFEPGTYPIAVVFDDPSGARLGSARYEIEILPVALPPQRLICTQWFHTDCIATHYGVQAWSEEHWRLIEQFIGDAVRHGVNMILTPTFTPPLDTEVGGERPTMQLVDVVLEQGEYRFGFDRLERWVLLCDRLGVEYFEFAHLFTQWGARHCPKIVARVDGDDQKIFGWHTRADSREYAEFLDSFLPALVSFIDAHGLRSRSYFHVSDEPRLADLESYTAASTLVRRHLADFPIMDALSDYEIYKLGAVGIPVPASNHIEPFIENDVRPLWTYYCVSQREAVSNRFFAMPSARNRILGLQLFAFNATGFLHWGYNFWYSQYSKRQIDPFTTTDAGHAFPSGDAFLVYPGPDEPIDSLRFEVFREALQDMRALSLLADAIGHDAVVALLEEGLDEPLSFSVYPHSADWLLAKREAVNRMLAEVAPRTSA
jgi:hypothetical protein